MVRSSMLLVFGGLLVMVLVVYRFYGNIYETNVSLDQDHVIHYIASTSDFSDVMKGLSKLSRSRILKIPGAISRLKKSRVACSAVFADVDVVLCPTVAHLTPPIGHLGMDLPFETLFPRVEKWACFTPYANATGGPSISLPLGFDPPTNLPVGMMFSADIGQEKLLLELALQLEQAQPWRKLQ